MNSTGTKPPLDSTRRTMSRAPVGCSMPATPVGVGWTMGLGDGPLDGPGVPAGAGEQAAARRRTRLARRRARAGRAVPEAGGWSVMARQTTCPGERFPHTEVCPLPVPESTAALGHARTEHRDP